MINKENTVNKRDEIIIKAAAWLIDSGHGSRVPVMLDEICKYTGIDDNNVFDLVSRFAGFKD